jgi:competence protein ComEC
MLRRLAPPHLLLAGYCAGLCLALAGETPPWVVAFLFLAPVAGLGLCVRRAARHGSRAAGVASAPLLLAALFLAGGLVVGGARLASLGGSELSGSAGRTVALTAVLTDLPAVKEQSVTLALAVESVDGRAVGGPAHLRLRLADGQTMPAGSTGPLSEGMRVIVDPVRVEGLPDARPGEFDYGRYLRRRGEHVLLEADAADLRLAGRRGGLQGAVDGLREASRAHLRYGVHGVVAEVLQGMVLGDDEGVDEAAIEDFRRSGLLHIMAVSGENVVLLCSMWAFGFSLLGIPRLARTALLVPVVLVYVLLTGASPSIVRAGISGVVGLLAVMASRPTDGWLLWLVPAAWLLTVNPNNLYDVSFQLSFGAVAGLLLLARPLTRLFRRLPGPLSEQAGVTTAASLATAPVSMLTFGSASLVSVPANLLGGFVLGPIMFLGMLSLLVGFVASWASAPLNVTAGLFIGFLLEVAHRFADLPWAVFEWRGLSLRLMLAGAAAGELVTLWALAHRAGVGLRAFVSAPARRLHVVVGTAGLLVVVLLLSPAPAAAPRVPTLTFLDVGEGAATLLQVPGGPTVLVDAGPSPLARTLREHAVEAIDLLILSHGHDDHVAGLEDVVGSVPVAAALLPEPAERSAALDELEATLRAEGAAVRRCDAALRVPGEGWSLEVVPSDPVGSVDQNQKENDDALVVVAELGGQRVLLPGDAEGAALAALDLPACAVVGVPHHGSAGGFDAALLGELSPRLAVVPVGPNRHGHPSADTISLLAAAGVPCARTDERGDVVLTFDGGRLAVRAERGT